MKNTLEELGFVFDGEEWILGNWDFSYNSTTKELLDINDGVGEPTLVAKIESQDHLKEVVSFLDINE